MNTTHRPTSQFRQVERGSSEEQPAVYQIRVRGVIGPEWSDWFGGVEVAPQNTGETMLTGPVADQAALHGIVSQLRDLNLPLISLIEVTEPEC